ncbi:discoidin domain-containing protein [Streptomyces sp. NBC_00872]|uniref:discoidin domain-containing protein n=1 Tax=Streptomyces sp. NBC_00872 TaxID=2903686 RepID=UPI00386F5EDE|nr:discoidin domain-containing protein [Streptomyces sp. NBC_00872]
MRLSRTHVLAPLLAGALAAAVPPLSYAEDRGSSPSCGAEADPGWSPTATRVDPVDSHHAYTGNGYLGTRVPPIGAGYAEDGAKTGWPLFTPRYDGAFAAGLYAREPSTTAGRQVLAALPTWTTVPVRVGDETFGEDSRISRYRQSVLLRCGVVRTTLRWTAGDGRATDLTYEVLTDRSDPHVGAVRLRLTPRWSGEATIGGGLDWRGARRLARTGEHRSRDADVTTFRTEGTGTTGAVATMLRPSLEGPTEGQDAGPTKGPVEDPAAVRTWSPARSPAQSPAQSPLGGSVGGPVGGPVGGSASGPASGPVPVHADRTYEFAKYVGVDTTLTSRDPRATAMDAALRAAGHGWQALFAANEAAWSPLWDADIDVPGQPDLQAWLRSAQYGLLTSTRQGSADSLAPTGLTSDNYAGLVFWDAETWMYPGLLVTRPELARSVLDYRFRTRGAAAANAEKLGFKGLFYPWTSGGEGHVWTECQSWYPPHCVTQNHLQGDVALAVWQYYLATGDRGWLRERGWPLLKGIAEFWVSRVTANDDGSYSVKEVAGPDEYSNGVTDGVFTNAGAATALRNAARAAVLVGERPPGEWTRIAGKIRVPYDARRKIYLQYAGYDGSRIKQADTVLLTYPLEWPMPAGAAAATLDHYAERTDPDGPAMTDSVHAIGAAAIGEPGCAAYTYLQRSIRPFVRGPFALFSEARGDKAGTSDPLAGAPAQDFLTGKGGFLQVFTHGLTGLRLREDGVRLDPMLPPQLANTNTNANGDGNGKTSANRSGSGSGVSLRGLHWQGRTYDIAIGARETTVRLTSGEPFMVHTPGGARRLSTTLILPTRRPDLTPTPNAARCRPATASSEQPGLYAAAAVDGSRATSWVPSAATASFSVDLGRTVPIGSVAPEWTASRPASHSVETSTDATRWQPLRPGARARHIRVTVRAPAGDQRSGIRELTVRTAKTD